MSSGINTPLEMTKIQRNAALIKANNPTLTTMVMGMLAGMFIALGGAASSMVTIMGEGMPFLQIKLVGSLIFTIGIISVIVAGGELFTGNILMSIAVFSDDLTWKKVFSNWVKVWFFNLIGAVLFAWLVTATKIFSVNGVEHFTELALNKANLSLSTAFIKGIACNIIVSLSVWTATAGKDGISKFYLSAFPIAIFVLLGFEHCVANMYYFPQALFLGADIPMTAVISRLLIVTLGNIVGGLVVSIPYYLANKKGLNEL